MHNHVAANACTLVTVVSRQVTTIGWESASANTTIATAWATHGTKSSARCHSWLAADAIGRETDE